MRFNQIVMGMVLALFAAGVAQADTSGPDGHAIIGTSGGHTSSCTSFASGTDDKGNINGGTNGACQVTGAPATSFTFAILDVNSNGGLTVTSPLTSIFPTTGAFGFLGQFNWTETCSSSNGVDLCTLTAPTMPTGQLFQLVNTWLTNEGVVNDGDCDLDDDIFGIPVGCDINISTATGQPFLPNVQFDASTNGSTLVPFPEPGVLTLLSAGLAGLPFPRRKFAR